MVERQDPHKAASGMSWGWRTIWWHCWMLAARRSRGGRGRSCRGRHMGSSSCWTPATGRGSRRSKTSSLTYFSSPECQENQYWCKYVDAERAGGKHCPLVADERNTKGQIKSYHEVCSNAFFFSSSSYRLANKQDKMNALLGSELIEILSLEKLVNQSRSLCHIVSAEWKSWAIPAGCWRRSSEQTSFLSVSFPGALFSLTGPTTLVGQEDSARSSLVAACHLPGLPRAVCSRGPGQKDASGGKRKGKDLEKWESAQKDQVRAIFIWVTWIFPT